MRKSPTYIVDMVNSRTEFARARDIVNHPYFKAAMKARRYGQLFETCYDSPVRNRKPSGGLERKVKRH